MLHGEDLDLSGCLREWGFAHADPSKERVRSGDVWRMEFIILTSHVPSRWKRWEDWLVVRSDRKWHAARRFDSYRRQVARGCGWDNSGLQTDRYQGMGPNWRQSRDSYQYWLLGWSFEQLNGSVYYQFFRDKYNPRRDQINHWENWDWL